MKVYVSLVSSAPLDCSSSLKPPHPSGLLTLHPKTEKKASSLVISIYICSSKKWEVKKNLGLEGFSYFTIKFFLFSRVGGTVEVLSLLFWRNLSKRKMVDINCQQPQETIYTHQYQKGNNRSCTYISHILGISPSDGGIEPSSLLLSRCLSQHK